MNVGSRGISSFSLGGRGVTVNLGRRGTKTTFTLPSTGISYQTHTKPFCIAGPLPSPAHPVPGPPVASRPTKSVRVYVVVAVAAVAGYLILRPVAPAPQRTAVPDESAPMRDRASLPVQAASRPLVPPAIASEVAETLGSLPSSNRSGIREGITMIGANVRSMPSLSGSVVTVLGAGSKVRIAASQGGWHHVLNQDDEPFGWVHESIVR